MKIDKKTKQVEFKGEYLTIKNYKEPLKEIPKKEGVGFYGCLLASVDGKAIQCHICGKMYDSLGQHIIAAHSMSVPDYKEKFELAKKTALVSEDRRMKMKAISTINFHKRWEMLRDNPELYSNFQRVYNKRKTTDQPKIALETKNKRGSCPDQLLAKIQEVKESIGHVPSLAEFVHETGGQRFKHLIYATFGSWSKALSMLGYEAHRASIKRDKKYIRYTREELLEYLTIFYNEHQVVPTSSDCKRGILPSEEAYVRMFGSLPKARIEAGIYRTDEELEDQRVDKRNKTMSQWRTK